MSGAGSVYNGGMPIDPITSAIVGSIIGNAVDQIRSLPPIAPPVPAVGLPRILPSGTTKGEMQVASPTSASVDGRPMVLAPGVQIRDPYNMTVLPGMIQRPVPVRYITDPAGAISRVWILSAQEAAQP
jgi:hypothetical protein